MTKLDMQKVAENSWNWITPEKIGALQVGVYVMAGGGLLGRSAAQQPSEFYIDDRVGRLPYARKAIMQAVDVLAIIGQKAGLDPRNMPEMPDLHGCGIF